jgi:hypothetical protein
LYALILKDQNLFTESLQVRLVHKDDQIKEKLEESFQLRQAKAREEI